MSPAACLPDTHRDMLMHRSEQSANNQSRPQQLSLRILPAIEHLRQDSGIAELLVHRHEPCGSQPLGEESSGACLLQGDVKKLTDDVAALKPSLFVAVPRVLERIQSGIVMKLKQKNWLVRFVFNLAYKWKLRAVKSGKPVDKVSSWGCYRQ